MNRIKQLKEKRSGLMQKFEALVNKDDFSPETDQPTADSLTAEIKAIDTQLDNLSSFEGLKQINNNGFHSGTETPDSEEKELGAFSLCKAFREGMNGKITGLEAELMADGAKEALQAGVAPDSGFVIPQKVLTAKPNISKMGLRGADGYKAMSVTGGSGAKGGNFVETVLSKSIIDILFEKLVLAELGATFFTDLVGNLTFPKPTRSAAKPAEKAETAESDELDPGADLISLIAKRLPARAEVTFQLLTQNNVSVEAWLRSYLASELALSWERLALNKIFAASGTGAVSVEGSFTFAKAVEFETKVAAANADQGNLAYLTNSKVRGLLKTTEKAANTARYIWENNEVNGYRAITTNTVPADFEKTIDSVAMDDLSGVIFGNWSDLYIGQWGGLQFLANPYTGAKDGKVELNVWTFRDEALARNESFAVCKDIITE